MTKSHWISLSKWVVYGAGAALLFTSFIVANSLYFPYITGKAFFFRIVVEIMFAAWLVLAVLDPEYRPRRSGILVSFTLFLIVTFISNCFGVNPVASFWSNFERMEGYVTIAHLFALVIVLGSVMKRRLEWSVVFHASVATSIIMVMQAFSQISSQGFEYRIDTTLGNPIYLAVYMLFNAFLSLWLIAELKKETVRHYLTSFRFWLYIAAFILQALILFQTQTRGAMLGLIGGLGVAAILTAVFARSEPAIRKIAAGALILVVILVVGVFAFKDASFVKNTQSLNRLTTIFEHGGTGQARLWNWGIAWQGIKERPLLGWGQGNYNFVYDKYFNPQMFEQEPWFDRTHNIILDWLIAGGFIGLLAYLSIIFCALYATWKSQSMTIFEKSVLSGLFVGYFVHNLFVFDHTVSYILFGFILAYIISQTSTNILFLQKPISKNMTFVLILAVIIATPFAIYGINRGGYVASRDLIPAIQIFKRDGEKLLYVNKNGLHDNLKMFQSVINLNTFGNSEIRSRLVTSGAEVNSINNLPIDMKQSFLNYVGEQITEQSEEVPGDARYPYLAASFFSQVGEFDKAVGYMKKAIDLGPNRQIFHFLLARIYLAQGDKVSAIMSAKFGYELAPRFDSAWIQYATILGLADKTKLTEEMTKQITEKRFTRVEKFIVDNIKRNPEVLSGYVSLSALYFEMGDSVKSVQVLDESMIKFPEAKASLIKLKAQILSGQNPVGKNF